MGVGQWRPRNEIDRRLADGDLQMAIAIAKDVRREFGHPIGRGLALRYLPLVAEQRPDDYERWATHWLQRWIEARQPTIAQIAEVADALAELAREPTAIDRIRKACG